MDDKLKDQIEKVVTAIFASKEEDTKRKKTEDALHASADKLESDWKNYVKDLSGLVNEYDIDVIQNKIELAKYVKSFFEKSEIYTLNM